MLIFIVELYPYSGVMEPGLVELVGKLTGLLIQIEVHVMLLYFSISLSLVMRFTTQSVVIVARSILKLSVT